MPKAALPGGTVLASLASKVGELSGGPYVGLNVVVAQALAGGWAQCVLPV